MALELVQQASSRLELIDGMHRMLLRATPCDPAEMIAIGIGILAWTEGKPSEAIPLAVNVGRDNDSIAGIVGMVAGTLYGVDAIPTEWGTVVEQANPEADLKNIAAQICQSIPII